MRTIITGGTILTPDQTIQGHDLVIENDIIAAIEPAKGRTLGGTDTILRAEGLLVTPGLIDLHIHGGMGCDTMDATPEALKTMGESLARHGVTGFLATTMSAPPEDILRAIDNACRLPQAEKSARLLGLHLEGPYFTSAYKGAQPDETLRNPDPQEYIGWFESGSVRLVSLAPELPGALEMIRAGAARGVRFAVGHTAAVYDQVIEAANAGMSQATHTFNGMLGLHHREPGTAGAVLDDPRIYAQIIADGIHLHPAIIRLVIRAKGVDRTLLVSDAIRAAGLADGEYDLGGQPVNVRQGIARTASGNLAGSTLSLDEAVRNILGFTDLTINQALAMASRVPAEAMGWEGKKGTLIPGADADITLFDQDLQVQKVIVGGKIT